ncbi:DUF4340 domain-containing protein [Candidatus Venteria ishoeyi]|uniref:DUF4340 domain-containing protein n=1 Tax=Candidatus Venteria ishoeyi TaxID=1899563 RepID=A0A1H6F974_9GAMM|nr:DUF4340 domain-containing protein [Candidatus Venteria ishoeyi]MDM8547516.1 DUF4340 domain-containing protein [Candidatus Venteria ishoeyi]SEH05666.1 Uncharacterised protein [Candidatus Venteria ishoeyi]
MNAKTISILAVVTLLVLFFAIQSGQPTRTNAAQTETPALFPDLAKQFNMLDEIHIQTAKQNFAIQREGEDQQWTLAGYPVPNGHVAGLLNGLVSLQKKEPKTSSAALYARLHVEDIGENAQSLQVALKRGADTVATLIIGKNHPAKTQGDGTEYYVRKPGEKQSWLVAGHLRPVQRKSLDWLDKEIVNLDSKQIKTVKVTQKDAEAVSIFKDKVEDGDYQLEGLPADNKLLSSKLNNLAQALSNLRLEDVKPLAEVQFPEDADSVAFTRFDGLEVTARLSKQDEKSWLHLSAAVNESVLAAAKAAAEAKAATDAKAAEKAKQENAEASAEAKPPILNVAEKVDINPATEAETLNQRLAKWAYAVPQYKADGFLPKKDSLYEAIKAESAAEAAGATPPIAPTAPGGTANQDFATLLRQAAEKAKQQKAAPKTGDSAPTPPGPSPVEVIKNLGQ